MDGPRWTGAGCATDHGVMDASTPRPGDEGFVAVPGRVPGGGDGQHDPSIGDETGGHAWLDGTAWQIGGREDVAWIKGHTTAGLTITSAIPAVFDAYATVVVPEDDEQQQLSDAALLGLLRETSPHQPWWLGYLETGASDVVFPDAPRVLLYSGWTYVLVKAGPRQAADWRRRDHALPWHPALPEVMFPLDRSWLVSTLWDDDWTCIGGPASLVEAILEHPHLEARTVGLDEDATPPGHVAR
jgi:hypothetical protein